MSPKGKRGFRPKALPPLRFVADDLDWSHGRGDEVRGAAAGLALAMSGRGALQPFSGPGQSEFEAVRLCDGSAGPQDVAAHAREVPDE